MENTANQRISLAIKNSGYKSVNAFSKATGISQPTLSGCVTGNKEPRLTLLSEIIKGLPRISAEWLITGEGSMYKEETKSGNVQIGTGNTMAGGDVRSEGGSVEIALLKKEIECLKGENERLMELIRMMRK